MKKSYFLIFSILLMGLIFGNLAQAQTSTQTCQASSTCIENPLSYDTFSGLISKITDALLVIALAISSIPIIIAGYYFVTSQDDPQKIKTAKNIILYTFIGLGIILFAKAINGILKAVLGLK